MGGWQMEVFRMAVYISFPVGLFYMFNQPAFYENWMMEKRAKIFPASDPRAVEILEARRAQRELQQEKEWLKEQQSKQI
ncbi:protein PET100 homolog, mitochondrial-like [Biomphalaria glabrata]|uniref:Protein PET100 homolog, mitochondrial-like n=1 Tax=Biomphalaria glabrata TaxID=6526 RepID=A0A9U8E998_BIOGL|nr:protein PET100 homolog, mitochondrial-like [Biomphalaria glabrata]